MQSNNDHLRLLPPPDFSNTHSDFSNNSQSINDKDISLRGESHPNLLNHTKNHYCNPPFFMQSNDDQLRLLQHQLAWRDLTNRMLTMELNMVKYENEKLHRRVLQKQANHGNSGSGDRFQQQIRTGETKLMPMENNADERSFDTFLNILHRSSTKSATTEQANISRPTRMEDEDTATTATTDNETLAESSTTSHAFYGKSVTADIEEEEEEEITAAAAASDPNRKQRTKIPNPTPEVIEYLLNIQQKFHNGELHGVSWTPPPPDSNEPLNKTWAYIWDPATQFPDSIVHQTCLSCPTTIDDSATTTILEPFGELEYEPHLWMDQTIYVFHRQLVCHWCGGKVSTISKEVLDRLPRAIAEQFPHDVLAS